MFLRLLFLTYIFSFNILLADVELDHPLTISELIDIALKNNPSTKQAWLSANRAAALLGSAKSRYYPKIGVDSFLKHGRDFKFINGPDTYYTIVGADLILNMILYDSGDRHAGVNAAKEALVAANWQSSWIIQKVMVKVLENTYATLHSQEIFQAACLSLKEVEKVLSAAQELNRAGLSSISDVYTSLASVAQMKMEVSQQRAFLDIHKGKLAASLGLPAMTNLTLAPVEPIQQVSLDQVDELIKLALRQRADLMAKQAKFAESLSNKEKAYSAYGPKVSFYGRGGANHAFHDKAQAAQYQLALNVDIPIFNGFDTTYKNALAYADMQLSREELAELELNISLEVLTHSRNLEAVQEMLPNAEDYLSNANKSYESVLEKYKAGKENITQISNAQRQLAAARVLYSDVKTRWLVSMANLAYVTGTLGMEELCD